MTQRPQQQPQPQWRWQSRGGGAGATHFLLYLNAETFVGEAGDRLAHELREVRAAGEVPVVMVHENDPARNGCPFSQLFASTPQDLVADDLYYATALALFPGPLWRVSVAHRRGQHFWAATLMAMV